MSQRRPVLQHKVNFTLKGIGINILIVESHMLSDLNSRFATIVTRNASIVDENKRLQEQVAQQSDNHAGKNLLNFTPLSFIARIHNRIYVTYF